MNFKTGYNKEEGVLKLLIKGDPKTKKNNPQLIGGRIPRLIPSKSSMKYEREGSKQIMEQMKGEDFNGFKIINKPINVKTVFYRETARIVDISNLFSAIHDILQVAKVIDDDSCDIIESVDGSRVRYDKDNPRTEITITFYKEDDDTMYKMLKDKEDRERKEQEERRKRREEREKEREKNKKRAAELRERGKTYKEIGEIIGVSQSTASKYVKDYKKKGD